MGLPKPDLVIFLQLSPAEAALRGHFGEERYETSVFQEAVKRKFEQLREDSSVNWQVQYEAGLDCKMCVQSYKSVTLSYFKFEIVSSRSSMPLGTLKMCTGTSQHEALMLLIQHRTCHLESCGSETADTKKVVEVKKKTPAQHTAFYLFLF